jgi:hypothetical protein
MTMVETKLTGPSMQERLNRRMRNSGDGTMPDTHAQHGTGPTRVHHNVHNTWNAQTGPFEGTPKQPAGPLGAPAANPDVRNLGKRR